MEKIEGKSLRSSAFNKYIENTTNRKLNVLEQIARDEILWDSLMNENNVLE